MTPHIVRTLSAVTLIPLLGLLACSEPTGPDAAPTGLPRALSALAQGLP